MSPLDSPSNRDSAKLPEAERSNAEQSAHAGAWGWLEDNVARPFVSGTGLLGIYNNFSDQPANFAAPKANNTAEWAVQTLSNVAGALVLYVPAGKLAGGLMKTLGRGADASLIGMGVGEGLNPAAARLLASDSAAQVIGAGAYDFAQKPEDGETRLGRATGTMAGFTVFEGGNRLLHGLGQAPLFTGARAAQATSMGDTTAYLASASTVGLARYGVGVLGGGIGYETTNLGNSLLTGNPNQASLDGLRESAISGGFINVALPVVQRGMHKAIDSTINSATWGRGIPVGRQLGYMNVDNPYLSALASEVPLARMKAATDGITRADVQSSTVYFAPGDFDKLGANIVKGGPNKGVNFAVHGPDATKLDLLIYDSPDALEPSRRLPMFRTGDTWHRFVPEAGAGTYYLLQADGLWDPAAGRRVNPNVALLDPYSRAITSDTTRSSDPPAGKQPHSGSDSTLDKLPKSIVIDPESFDWQGDKRPGVSLDDTIILETNLRGFTARDPAIEQQLRGTYKGLAEKAQFLKGLGITTVQLMPIMEFDADDTGMINPRTGQRILNSWGYNTVGFMAPDGDRAADGKNGSQVNEFKQMVKTLHENGIEVVLDIVLNHTREGGEHGPTLHFRGLSNEDSYMLEPNEKSKYVNHSGVGNTVNTNHPSMQKFIIDTLRYWADEMHVDGFRFDLASIFKYDIDGRHKFKTPVLEAIENDPVLSKLKLIAEPWTATGAYDRGSFSDRIWMEQDGKSRDVIRKYVRGDESLLWEVRNVVRGSPEEFDRSTGRRPNTFVVYHDGMTGRDLVSYDHKHNEENGEDNRDGDGTNNSWNSGYEGPVKDSDVPKEQQQQIEDLRMQLMKNKVLLQLMSQGVPTIYYLDMFAQSNEGNNNIWGQPARNELNWDLANQQPGAEYFDFLKFMINLRKEHGIGGYDPTQIQFHGVEPKNVSWGASDRFMGFTYPNTALGKNLHVYMNGWWDRVDARLPDSAQRLVYDTAPWFNNGNLEESRRHIANRYTVAPRAFTIFTSQSTDQ
jgi:isoamylase